MMFHIEVSTSESDRPLTREEKADQLVQGKHWFQHNRKYLTIMFHHLCIILLDCRLSSQMETQLIVTTEILKSQLVTYSILPLETYLLLSNDEVMPGLTKILQMEQDFPYLKWNPEDVNLWKENAHKIQSSWVFLFECSEPQPTWVKYISSKFATELNLDSVKQEMASYVFEFVKRAVTTYAHQHINTAIY